MWKPLEKEISELFSFSRGFHIGLDGASSSLPATRRGVLERLGPLSFIFSLPAPLNAKPIQLGSSLRLERGPELCEGVSGW